MVSAIAAMGRNRVLGLDNELLWRIPDDLKRFKRLTLGHPVIMGRKTFESIGRPLPGRTNIVITRDKKWHCDGVVTAHSVIEGIEEGKRADPEEVFVIGGGQIYEQALPYTDRLYLTLIDEDKKGDVYFPEYEKLFTDKIGEEAGEWNGLKYRWVDLERAVV